MAIMTTLTDNGLNLNMRLFDPKLSSTNQASNYDHRGAQLGGDKHFGNPVTAANNTVSELASTNLEQQGTLVTDGMAEDYSEQHSTQHHHEPGYRPR